MRLSVLRVGSKNSPKTRKNTPKWVKISIFLPKSPQNPPENGFWGGSGQFSAQFSGKTSKIVVKFRGGGVLRIDPYTHGGVRTPRGSVKRHVRRVPLYGVSLRTLGYVITDPRVRNYVP